LEVTKLFFITYFAAFAGVIPPGLINMSVAKTCLQYGKRNGVMVALGASIIVVFQALIAILLAKYIFGNPFIQIVLLRTGLVIFLIMAIFFFVKAKSNKVKAGKVPKYPGRRLAAALGTFTVLYGYVLGFQRIEKKSASFTKYSNYFMGALMLLLVLITFIRITYFE